MRPSNCPVVVDKASSLHTQGIVLKVPVSHKSAVSITSLHLVYIINRKVVVKHSYLTRLIIIPFVRSTGHNIQVRRQKMTPLPYTRDLVSSIYHNEPYHKHYADPLPTGKFDYHLPSKGTDAYIDAIHEQEQASYPRSTSTSHGTSPAPHVTSNAAAPSTPPTPSRPPSHSSTLPASPPSDLYAGSPSTYSAINHGPNPDVYQSTHPATSPTAHQTSPQPIIYTSSPTPVRVASHAISHAAHRVSKHVAPPSVQHHTHAHTQHSGPTPGHGHAPHNPVTVSGTMDGAMDDVTDNAPHQDGQAGGAVGDMGAGGSDDKMASEGSSKSVGWVPQLHRAQSWNKQDQKREMQIHLGMMSPVEEEKGKELGSYSSGKGEES